MKTNKNVVGSYETPMINVLLVKVATIIAQSSGETPGYEDPE